MSVELILVVAALVCAIVSLIDQAHPWLSGAVILLCIAALVGAT